MDAMDDLIRLTVLYGSKVWGPMLLDLNWAIIEILDSLGSHALLHHQMQEDSSPSHYSGRVCDLPLKD